MAKRRNTKPTLSLVPLQRACAAALATIAFRPGLELGQAIDRFAQLHELSRAESGKRLACIGIWRFDAELHYVLLAELANLIGGREPFASACYQMSKILADQKKAMGKPLSREVITAVLHGTVEATKREPEITIDADTVVGAVTSKD